MSVLSRWASMSSSNSCWARTSPAGFFGGVAAGEAALIASASAYRSGGLRRGDFSCCGARAADSGRYKLAPGPSGDIAKTASSTAWLYCLIGMLLAVR